MTKVPARVVGLVGAIALLGSGVAGCTSSDVDPADISFPDIATSTSTSTSAAPHESIDLPTPTTVPIPVGGVVRVGMWAEPDQEAPTLAGAIVRSMTQPQLFEPGPEGSWIAGLVEPGSDLDGDGLRSASFRLRTGAVWSNGSPITADDLRRSADTLFVESIVSDGEIITVSFNQPLPNWRMLWSGTEVVEPPSADVFGGPFAVGSVVAGLETVLVPNDVWWGDGPYLDELHLVVVPDQDIMMRLFARGDLDVMSPMPSVGRLAEIDLISNVRDVSVDRADGFGWWTGLTMDPDQVGQVDREVLASTLDPALFVGSLLKDEAIVIKGQPTADFEPAITGTLVTITSPDDVPMLAAALRAVVLEVRRSGGITPEIREAASDLAEPWISQGAPAWAGLNYEGPGRGCWTCAYGDIDESAARLADGGGEPLDALLGERAIVDRWWHPVVVTAADPSIVGVEANGWALGPAWNAELWWLDPTDGSQSAG
ncbi:MAG: hypothetical protein GY925_12790 [Actinomycetia bacterium]|nr:hypothetical protein [Actinomycetes bacterium]